MPKVDLPAPGGATSTVRWPQIAKEEWQREFGSVWRVVDEPHSQTGLPKWSACYYGRTHDKACHRFYFGWMRGGMGWFTCPRSGEVWAV